MNHFKQKKGIALLLVLSTVALVSVLIVDLNYNSRLTYTMAINYKNSVSSYYLAKSSVNIALLRLAIVNKLGDMNFGQIKIPNSVLEFIWNMPFFYPFTKELFMMSGQSQVSMGLKTTLDKLKKETNISKVGYFSHQIKGLDSKININLVSKDEVSVQRFIEMMRNHYNNKIENDEDFGLRYPVEDFFEVINNIIDWIDKDDISRNGGSEDYIYESKNYDFKPRNYSIPSLKELHLVEGLNDELFDFIEPLITVFSSGSINVNKIDEQMWKIIDYRLSDEDIKLINEKINEQGGFSNIKELITWIGENTLVTSTNFNPLKIPLTFDDKTYKISAKGIVGNFVKNLICYVSKSYEESMGISNLNQNPQSSTNINTNNVGAINSNNVKSYKPKIVFWELD